MAELKERDRRIIRVGGVTTAAVAVALIVLSAVGVSDLPIFLPLLLLVAGGGLLIAAGKPGGRG